MTSTGAVADRWERLLSGSALVAAFGGSLLYRLIAGRTEFLSLCLITLLVPFIPVAASAVLILATGLLFLARRTGAGRWRELSGLPLFKQALVFWLVLLFLSAFSVTPRESLQFTILFGVYIAFYLMCLTELRDERKIYILTAVFLASVALEACFGLYQYFISRPLVDPGWVDAAAFPGIAVRVFGTLDNPNILAQYLVPGIVLGLALALRPGGARLSTRVLFLGGAAIATASLVYTWSRMGWLALGLAITVFLLFYDRRLLLLVAAAAILAVVLRPDLLSDRLTSILNLSQDSSFYYRLLIWQVAFAIIGDFWFCGVGPGTAAFQSIYNKFYTVYAMPVYHTHSFFLEMLVELGVFGTGIFLWLLLSYWGQACICIKHDRRATALRAQRPVPAGRDATDFPRIAAMASLAGMAGYLFMGLTESSWYNFKLVFLFWFLFTVTASSCRLLQRAPGAASLAPGSVDD